MARRSDIEVPPGLESILLPGERLVVAVHAHWARLAKPVAISLGILVLTLFVDANLTPSTAAVGNVFWFAWFASLAWLGWQFLQWRHDWFAATDKRLLLRYGIITHKVAMMPLMKVTDMSYVRSIPGQLIGFGKFVLESAGQDQAMRTVPWVPNPDETYRAICAEIFNVTPPSGPADSEPDDPGDQTGPIDPTGGGTPGDEDPTFPQAGPDARVPDPFPDVPPIHNPIQDRLSRWSTAIPIQHQANGMPLYQSEDLRKKRSSGDTGPIPIQERRWRKK